jgi:hypothetical protein
MTAVRKWDELRSPDSGMQPFDKREGVPCMSSHLPDGNCSTHRVSGKGNILQLKSINHHPDVIRQSIVQVM